MRPLVRTRDFKSVFGAVLCRYAPRRYHVSMNRMRIVGLVFLSAKSENKGVILKGSSPVGEIMPSARGRARK